MPVDPTFAVRGGEWSIGSLAPVDRPTLDAPAAAPQGDGFANALAGQIGHLEALQTDAASASAALATGAATDPTQVVMAVERARLSMQLASQIRTKAVEAAQEIFRTQV